MFGERHKQDITHFAQYFASQYTPPHIDDVDSMPPLVCYVSPQDYETLRDQAVAANTPYCPVVEGVDECGNKVFTHLRITVKSRKAIPVGMVLHSNEPAI